MKVEYAVTRTVLLLPLPWIVFAVIMSVLWPNLPRWEGAAFPVTNALQVVNRGSLDDGTTVIDVTVKKLRACEYKSMAFYWTGEDGSLHGIPWRDLKPPHRTSSQDPSRPVGVNKLSIIVDTMLDIETVTGYTRHKCHPFWDTVTKVWP
jgi:hypothetical protein